MFEWREVTLGEVAELTVGFVGTMARHYEDLGVPFLRSQNVLPHRIELGDTKFISDEFNARIPKSQLRPGDVVTVRTGTPGTTAVIPDTLRLANCADLVITRPGPELDARWFSYYMNSMASHSIASALVGAVQQHFNVGSAKQMRLSLPPLAEQQAIVEVLGALDDKITTNTALTSAADSLLATEFRARLHQTEAPDKALAAVANVVLGGTPSRARLDYWTDGTIPWLNSGAVNATRIVEPSELITPDALANSSAKIMPRGATLLAITGATLGQIARLEMSASGNQSIVGVWSDDVELNIWLYFAIQARLDNLLVRATGAAQQHVSKGDVEQLAVPVPSQSVLEEFASVAAPLLEMAAIAERASRTLAATRDALLPQLMSGKLLVRDAEVAASNTGV